MEIVRCSQGLGSQGDQSGGLGTSLAEEQALLYAGKIQEVGQKKSTGWDILEWCPLI